MPAGINTGSPRPFASGLHCGEIHARLLHQPRPRSALIGQRHPDGGSMMNGRADEFGEQEIRPVLESHVDRLFDTHARIEDDEPMCRWPEDA